MVSIASFASFVSLFYVFDIILFILPYSNGGIKYFEDFNETWPFIQYKMEKVILNYVRGEQSFFPEDSLF